MNGRCSGRRDDVLKVLVFGACSDGMVDGTI